jgi:hypothetical protein
VGSFQFSAPATALTPGQYYLFTISATYTDAQNYSVSSSSALVFVNRPPFNGQVECSPATGVSLLTTFHVLTLAWSSTSFPLVYSFNYNATAGNGFVVKPPGRDLSMQ